MAGVIGRSLAAAKGPRGWVERLPQTSQGTWPERCAADHLGRLYGAIRKRRRVFPRGRMAALHRHWYRNIFSHVPSTKVREIAATLKAIHASEDVVAAREKGIRVIDKLRGLRLAKPAELAEPPLAE